jgi:hypothetical protein
MPAVTTQIEDGVANLRIVTFGESRHDGQAFNPRINEGDCVTATRAFFQG